MSIWQRQTTRREKLWGKLHVYLGHTAFSGLSSTRADFRLGNFVRENRNATQDRTGHMTWLLFELRVYLFFLRKLRTKYCLAMKQNMSNNTWSMEELDFFEASTHFKLKKRISHLFLFWSDQVEWLFLEWPIPEGGMDKSLCLGFDL